MAAIALLYGISHSHDRVSYFHQDFSCELASNPLMTFFRKNGETIQLQASNAPCGLEVFSVSRCVVWRDRTKSQFKFGYGETGSIPHRFLENIGEGFNRFSHKAF
jgi:hypothetical protein